MDITRTRFLRLIRLAGFALVIAALLGFVIWRSLPYARGPAITLFQPVSGSSVTTKTVAVVGRAERVKSLTIDGNQITLDEAGNFKETIAVFPGVNTITLSATDQFGRKQSNQIEILGL